MGTMIGPGKGPLFKNGTLLNQNQSSIPGGALQFEGTTKYITFENSNQYITFEETI